MRRIGLRVDSISETNAYRTIPAAPHLAAAHASGLAHEAKRMGKHSVIAEVAALRRSIADRDGRADPLRLAQARMRSVLPTTTIPQGPRRARRSRRIRSGDGDPPGPPEAARLARRPLPAGPDLDRRRIGGIGILVGRSAAPLTILGASWVQAHAGVESRVSPQD